VTRIDVSARVDGHGRSRDAGRRRRRSVAAPQTILVGVRAAAVPRAVEQNLKLTLGRVPDSL